MHGGTRQPHTHARQSAAAAQPQPPAPKLPGPIEQVEGITPSLLAALSCHHTAAVGHHVHMGTAQARRGVGRACGGQRVRTLCSAPPRPKHCPGRATASGHCDAGGGTCGAQCAVSDVGWLRRARSRRSRRRSPPDRPVEVVGSRRICSPRVSTSRCRSAAVVARICVLRWRTWAHWAAHLHRSAGVAPNDAALTLL